MPHYSIFKEHIPILIRLIFELRRKNTVEFIRIIRYLHKIFDF
jgi:hypothetical protein